MNECMKFIADQLVCDQVRNDEDQEKKTNCIRVSVHVCVGRKGLEGNYRLDDRQTRSCKDLTRVNEGE